MGRRKGTVLVSDYTKPTKKMYMMVTSDEYQLPLAFADNAAELARMVGLRNPTFVVNAIHNNKKRHLKKCKYVEVIFDDDEEWGEEYK